jgi:tRNA-2-methylthio-N6-dimethylallyladenosine synthase
VVQDRFGRLVAEIERIAGEENRRLTGAELEVLAGGEGRKDDSTGRMSGRAPDGRLVHFAGAGTARPGDAVTVRVEAAGPHHLLGTALAVRPTRAGDAWEGRGGGCGSPAGGGGAPPSGTVTLGMPTLRVGR